MMRETLPIEPANARGTASPVEGWDLLGGEADFFATDEAAGSSKQLLDKDPLAPPAVVEKSKWTALTQGLPVVPAWLVSMAVHLVAIVSLALVANDPLQQGSGPIIASSFVAADSLVLEEIIYQPQELEELASNLSEPDSDDAGSSLADQSAFLSAPTASDVSDNQPFAAAAGEGEYSGDLEGNGGNGGQKKGKGDLLGAEFFGVQASGKRFVFIVDSSRSMRGPRFHAAKQELMYAIRKLSKDQSFFVMFFDRHSKVMTFAPKTSPEKIPVKATRENIAKLEKWVGTVKHDTRTDPYESVRMSLDIMPDAVYLLTDGKFTDDGKTVSFLAENNFMLDPLPSSSVSQKIPKVVFHTIGFSSRQGEETLKYISKISGGTYRFVPIANGLR